MAVSARSLSGIFLCVLCPSHTHSLALSLSVCLLVPMHVYMYVCVCVCVWLRGCFKHYHFIFNLSVLQTAPSAHSSPAQKKPLWPHPPLSLSLPVSLPLSLLLSVSLSLSLPLTVSLF